MKFSIPLHIVLRSLLDSSFQIPKVGVLNVVWGSLLDVSSKMTCFFLFSQLHLTDFHNSHYRTTSRHSHFRTLPLSLVARTTLINTIYGFNAKRLPPNNGSSKTSFFTTLPQLHYTKVLALYIGQLILLNKLREY